LTHKHAHLSIITLNRYFLLSLKMIKIERVIHKTFLLIALGLSLAVEANTHFDPTLVNANLANSFSYMPNMMGANNWTNYGGANNWQPYNNNTNMMQMMGGVNMNYVPYNGMMPYTPNNNWMPSGANSNLGSFGAYNNMMPMMGVNGAMPYTGYNNMMPNNMMSNNMMSNNMMSNNVGLNQANMNTGLSFNQTLATPELTNAWGSLDANAAWGLGDDLNAWTQQAQTNNLSSQDPADVIAQLMSGEHATVYQQIIADAYEKGFADAIVQSGSGGICVPNTEELPEFSLDSE